MEGSWAWWLAGIAAARVADMLRDRESIARKAEIEQIAGRISNSVTPPSTTYSRPYLAPIVGLRCANPTYTEYLHSLFACPPTRFLLAACRSSQLLELGPSFSLMRAALPVRPRR